MSAPLTPEDFDLTPDQLTELVVGAQTFLAPAPDPEDDERLGLTLPETP